MAQFARPDSDISVTAYGGYGWRASTGSSDPLYPTIDEVVADDTDYARFRGGDSEAGYSYYKLGLSDIDEPSDKSTLSIRIRVQNTSDYGDLRLYEGSTLIKRFNGPGDGFATGSKRNLDFAIPESDANNITDYTDLNLWIGIDDDSYGYAYIYQVYLEAGDAGGSSETTDKKTFNLTKTKKEIGKFSLL
tara:strand:- start:55951 stop:56520 length:570 start_codon:yes stop_codon:yes gene_type:complete